MEDVLEIAVRGRGQCDFPAGSESLATEWDARVESWADVCAGPAFQRFRDRVVAEAAPARDADVVDIGCGTGLLALAFAPRVRRVWALDVSPGMVADIGRRARHAGIDNIIALCADARVLPLPDESIDLAVSSYALHHVDAEGKHESLDEAYRVLRPGGRLIVVDMMFSVSLRRDDRRVIGQKALQVIKKGPAGVVRLLRNATRVARGTWEHPASPEWWSRAAEGHGFSEVQAGRLEQEAGILIAVKPAA